MEHTIRSRKLKGKEFTFLWTGVYIRLWDDKKKEWDQIGKGGGFMGSMLEADTEKEFIRKVKLWMRDYLEFKTPDDEFDYGAYLASNERL
jgi:hypothetical protein